VGLGFDLEERKKRKDRILNRHSNDGKVVCNGFSNTLAIKDLYNRLTIAGEKFDKYSAARRDVTDDLFLHIDQAVERDLNVNAEINGKGGEGKSTIGIGLATEIRKAQRKYDKYDDTEIIYTFDFDQSQKAIRKYPFGTIIVQDELNELVGEMSNTTVKSFNNLIRSYRKTNMCFILNNIDYVPIKGLHFVLEPYGFFDKYFEGETNDIKKMVSIVWVRYIDDDHSSKEIYLGMAKIPVYKYLDEFRKYRKYKDKNLMDIKNTGGRRNARFTKEERQRLARDLLEEAKRQGWSGSKTKLHGIYQDANLNLDTNQKKMVLNEAMEIYRKDFMKKKTNYLKSDKLDDETAEFFENYYIEHLKKEDLKDYETFLKNIKIIPRTTALWATGRSQEDIAAIVGKKPNLINNIIKTMREGTDFSKKYQFGYVFEAFITQKFDLIQDGRIGMPDFYVKNLSGDSGIKVQGEKICGPGEIKIFDKYRNSITLNLEGRGNAKRTLRPSSQFCKKHNIRFFPVFLRMNKWLDKETSRVYNYLVPIDTEGEHTFAIERYDCHERFLMAKGFKLQEFFSDEYQKELIGNAVNTLD
jgi:hypothetical protein